VTDWEDVLVIALALYIAVTVLIASPIALVLYILNVVNVDALLVFFIAFVVGLAVIAGAMLVSWAFLQGREALSAAFKGAVKFYAEVGPLLTIIYAITSNPSKHTIIALLLLWLACLALYFYMEELE